MLASEYRALRHSVKPAVRTMEISLITKVPNVIIIWWESGRLALPHDTIQRIVDATTRLIDRDLETGARAIRISRPWQVTRTIDGRDIGEADHATQ